MTDMPPELESPLGKPLPPQRPPEISIKKDPPGAQPAAKAESINDKILFSIIAMSALTTPPHCIADAGLICTFKTEVLSPVTQEAELQTSEDWNLESESLGKLL